MGQEEDFLPLEDAGKREERIISEVNALFQPAGYKRVFFAPQGAAWKVDASFVEGYYESARTLVEGITQGTFREAVEGVAAVFLCRHYLELAVKFALFHSRWLKERTFDEPSRNAPDGEVESVEPDHNLRCLWSILESELNRRAPDVRATGLDLEFVRRMVEEFQQVDKSSTRFRYPPKLAVAPAQTRQAESLGISFESLLENLVRAHNILDTLDKRLVNSYGLNQDWGAELNSL